LYLKPLQTLKCKKNLPIRLRSSRVYYGNYSSLNYGGLAPECYLTPEDTSFNACYFNWAACAFSIFICIFLAVSTGCAVSRRGTPAKPTLVAPTFLITGGWWLAAAIINTGEVERKRFSSK
jgi:hypothetical protein